MIEASPFEASDETAWDELAARSPMATFLHTRRFLTYHGDRFEDASLVLREGEKLLGVLPAARDRADAARVVSHPGATFGGLVHDGGLGGQRAFEALGACAAAFRGQDYSSLLYKTVPWIYQRIPSGDDLHALFRLGAERTRVDLSCAIDLAERRAPSSRRKRGLKKAEDAGIELSESRELLPAYWAMLEESLKRRYDVEPVHTVEEIERLADLFPEQIGFLFATHDGEPVAGIVIFSSPQVDHVQYSASGELGRETSAIDLVTERAIAAAEAAGRRFFDFGVSSEADGRELNADLYRFKYEFGGCGVVHEFHELAL